MEKLVINNLNVDGDCNLFHHGIVLDHAEKKSFEMHAGHLYGLIGEFGDGGAAISCGITGNTDHFEGDIYIDEEKVTKDLLVNNSWYIGNDMYKYKSSNFFGLKPKINKHTIKEQIEDGIKSNAHLGYDFFQIQQMFHVSNERVVRNIEFVSGERWKASAAIGFAQGKNVFCYPWMNTRDIKRLEEQLADTVQCLISHGKIVILPTTRKENIEKVFANGQIIIL